MIRCDAFNLSNMISLSILGHFCDFCSVVVLKLIFVRCICVCVFSFL